MKLKTIPLALALFSFSAFVFAKPMTYSFSTFGGGLPSSASVLSASDSDTTTQTIIVEDDEYPEDEYSDEPTVKKNKKGALIATYVVLGVLVTAGIVIGAVYLTNESAQCCEESTNNFMDSCTKGCGEGCGQATGQACSDSMAQSCSSSSGSSASSCSSSSISALLQGNAYIIPVFIP